MTDRPRPFTGPEVRAILDGRKTQFREVLKTDARGYRSLRRYEPGQRLWVREKHWIVEIEGGGIGCPYLVYDDEWSEGPGARVPRPKQERIWFGPPYDDEPRFGARSSTQMPRWASRLTLTVTGNKIQRLQEISEEDAIAEGCQAKADGLCTENPDHYLGRWSARTAFKMLWANIHGNRHGHAWKDNPWVEAPEFTVQFANIDSEDIAA